ncbi:hypothetical protein LOK49_LG08G02505 [Camellia lanceoleosa]|uniref:Uncharacterized protein n=1 Tax=Camellia lanceoleosa TaxID=1840588 RepID=A0ACC0GQL4_9ERIC|nr:hypothetical protein LOK49_LG08G02505 [Camellia lanceoleosa]
MYPLPFSAKWTNQLRFDVHVISEVPDTPSPLKIHCKSSDKDLGVQLVNNGQDFRWSFRETFFGTILYFCLFGWNANDQSFDVFSSTLERHCQRQEEPWLRVWPVRPDSFYQALYFEGCLCND